MLLLVMLLLVMLFLVMLFLAVSFLVFIFFVLLVLLRSTVFQGGPKGCRVSPRPTYCSMVRCIRRWNICTAVFCFFISFLVCPDHSVLPTVDGFFPARKGCLNALLVLLHLDVFCFFVLLSAYLYFF